MYRHMRLREQTNDRAPLRLEGMYLPTQRCRMGLFDASIESLLYLFDIV